MDYTKNHHLPQWVKSDRIMMDDFNQMCRDIEAGLNKTASSSDMNLLNSAISVIEAAQARCSKRLEDMFRDSYRQTVQQMIHHGPAGLSDSIWANSLSASAETGAMWSGGPGVHLSSRTATEAGIRASAKEISYIFTYTTTSSTCRTAAVQFTSDGYGILEQVKLFTEASNYYYNGGFNSFYITFTRTDTGAVVARSGPFAPEGNHQTDSFYMRQGNFPLLPGVPYQMEFSVPEGLDYRAVTGFLLASSRNPVNTSQKLIIRDLPATANISKTIKPPAWAKSGILLLRWAGTGSITPSVSGAQISHATQSRAAINAQGESCQETEYSLENLSGGNVNLTLSMQRSGTDLHLYDYGVLWR